MACVAPATLAGLLTAVMAAPALADDVPAARDVQAAVETCLATARPDANLVGAPGSAGYDAGFWIRGGDFLLRINLTLQARYEFFDFEGDMEGQARRILDPGAPNGFRDVVLDDVSGFSVPRTTLKLSGMAPCSMRYYVELEFGHFGRGNLVPFQAEPRGARQDLVDQSNNFDVGREAWLEWGSGDAFNFRMGLIKTPSTRQMMTPPELQLFADISMASAVTGLLMPGYTDRNRDHGLMLHGLFGCNNEFQYMVAVTNGDGGDSIRNVLDFDTSDNLAYSARLNWTFLKGVGYTEGATRQDTCTWYGEVGGWAYFYADRFDRPPANWNGRAYFDRIVAGLDLALGFGGFSFTGAFTYADMQSSDIGLDDETWAIWLVQAGYLFPGTAWEIAARWSAYTRTIKDFGGDLEPKTNEFGLAINYYLNGHANKLTLDAAFLAVDDDGGRGGYFDTYSGVPLGWDAVGDSLFIRIQWQLAL